MNVTVLDRVLYNLNTLSGCPRGGKINSVGDYIVVEHPSMVQWMFRTCRRDSKERAATRIYADVSTAIDFVNLMLENPAAHVKDIKNILSGLRAAAIGVDRLCSTYYGYESFLAPMRSISHMISQTDGKIVRALQDLGEN